MSEFPPIPDPASDLADEARLQSRLDQAYSTEPAELSLARLERRWQELRRPPRRGVKWRRALVSAAAAVVLVSLVAILSYLDRDPLEAPTARRQRTDSPVTEPSPPPEGTEGEGLTPTRIQQVLFTVRSPKVRESREELAGLLSQVEGSSPAEAEARLLEEGMLTPAKLKTRLEREWTRLPPESQPMAAALLAGRGGRKSLATLRRMSRDTPLRHAIMLSLLDANDLTDVATVLEIAPADEVARALLSDPSLARHPRAFEAYLGLVYQARTRPAALATLRTMETPPIDPLLAALDSEEKGVRVAAALALGELGGAEVTQRLIEIVTGGNRRHAEAWLAVVQCRGPLADEFLAIASRDPLLLGHYNAALIRHHQLIP